MRSACRGVAHPVEGEVRFVAKALERVDVTVVHQMPHY